VDRAVEGKGRTVPTCPECSAQIGVDDEPQLNEIVQCPECGSELEVVKTSPVGLATAPDVEEDWGE
jgi:alpha-aminoadipate carrier protein LysW